MRLRRSIPTCVGQPITGTSSNLSYKVYPHVCGAATSVSKVAHSGMGLSPRVWGSRLVLHAAVVGSRSIPTCVGQPQHRGAVSGPAEVYPHVCGAAPVACGIVTISRGLSPRVWGSRELMGYAPVYGRSIPTCVGQPRLSRSLANAARVYPHVCGAADIAAISTRDNVGLSPRVWGSLVVPFCESSSHRSIPTCVGQPDSIRDVSNVCQVYPHVCGAAIRLNTARRPRPGLSPRVWGSQNENNPIQDRKGSIPTCVGQPHQK